ncbi:MAG: outer membrane beta-barrel protein [Prolixibacteraceae bacterium]
MKKKNTTESEIFAQIKQSLENYEEAYIPGSWEGFVRKRAAGRRRLYLRIASGIAACLLVGFVGLNYFHSEKPEKFISVAQQSEKVSKENVVPEKTAVAKNAPLTAAILSNIQPSKYAATEISAKKETEIGKEPIRVKEFIAEAGQKKKSVKVEKYTVAGHPVALSVAADSAQKIPEPSKTIASQQTAGRKDTISGIKDTIKTEALKAFQHASPKKEDQTFAAATKRKVRFGVNFSPSLNTSRSSGSINYMGGLSADIPLFSKFQLSTGLQVENQSVLNEFQGAASSSALGSSTAPLNQTRTKLINLDVPVNLTWTIVSEKSHSYYVSAGLSSLVYLRQENKNTNYTQLLVPSSSVVTGDVSKTYSVVNQVFVTQSTVTPNQTFDLGGRINIMVGFERKITERFFIHLEPYTKIPTSGQSPGSLNHTTSGINFKISF